MSHQSEARIPPKASHTNTCENLREVVMFDFDDFRQQLHGSTRTGSGIHDDAAGFVGTHVDDDGQRNNQRVDLSETVQYLSYWTATQSDQTNKLIARLEQLSSSLSRCVVKSPIETFSNELDTRYEQIGKLAAIRDDALNTYVDKGANRFLKLAALQPSSYVEPPDVPFEEQSLKKLDMFASPADVHCEAISAKAEVLVEDRMLDTFHLVASLKHSVGRPMSKRYSELEGYKKSVGRPMSRRVSEDEGHKRKRSETNFVLNVALHEDDDTDLLTMSPGKLSCYDGASEDGTVGCIRRYPQIILQTLAWDFFIAFTIVSYAAYMGFQVDWTVRNIGVQVPIEQVVTDFIYTSVFTVELLLRILAESLHFWSFYNRLIFWNCLDSLIVITSLAENCYDAYWLILTGSGSESGALGMDSRQIGIIRLLRTVSILKIFRVFRLVTFIRALRHLVFSITHTLKALVWALVLLFLFVYVIAIALAGAVGEHKRNYGCDAAARLCLYWGDLPKAMLSLFSAVAGGVSWYDIVTPLIQHLNPVWTVLFLAYVCFVYFAVLNVVTGVFCESAIENAKADVEMAIREAMEKKAKYIKKLDKLFSWIDTDASDEITLVELETYMAEEMSGAFFEILELEVDYPDEVLRLIDTDRSGQISKDEFIDGICRLRGPATALQVAQLGHNLSSQIQDLMSDDTRGQHMVRRSFYAATSDSRRGKETLGEF